jgi:hypothetical protein
MEGGEEAKSGAAAAGGARGKTCYLCGGEDHVAKACPKYVNASEPGWLGRPAEQRAGCRAGWRAGWSAGGRAGGPAGCPAGCAGR